MLHVLYTAWFFITWKLVFQVNFSMHESMKKTWNMWITCDEKDMKAFHAKNSHRMLSCLLHNNISCLLDTFMHWWKTIHVFLWIIHLVVYMYVWHRFGLKHNYTLLIHKTKTIRSLQNCNYDYKGIQISNGRYKVAGQIVFLWQDFFKHLCCVCVFVGSVGRSGESFSCKVCFHMGCESVHFFCPIPTTK
jgi:hypothetical protein